MIASPACSKELLNQPANISENNLHLCNQEITTHDTSCIECERKSPVMINDIITYEEFIKSTENLHNDKTSGMDGIIGELIKNSKEFITPLLAKLYNNIS